MRFAPHEEHEASKDTKKNISFRELRIFVPS